MLDLFYKLYRFIVWILAKIFKLCDDTKETYQNTKQKFSAVKGNLTNEFDLTKSEFNVKDLFSKNTITSFFNLLSQVLPYADDISKPNTSVAYLACVSTIRFTEYFKFERNNLTGTITILRTVMPSIKNVTPVTYLCGTINNGTLNLTDDVCEAFGDHVFGYKLPYHIIMVLDRSRLQKGSDVVVKNHLLKFHNLVNKKAKEYYYNGNFDIDRRMIFHILVSMVAAYNKKNYLYSGIGNIQKRNITLREILEVLNRDQTTCDYHISFISYNSDKANIVDVTQLGMETWEITYHGIVIRIGCNVTNDRLEYFMSKLTNDVYKVVTSKVDARLTLLFYCYVCCIKYEDSQSVKCDEPEVYEEQAPTDIVVVENIHPKYKKEMDEYIVKHGYKESEDGSYTVEQPKLVIEVEPNEIEVVEPTEDYVQSLKKDAEEL